MPTPVAADMDVDTPSETAVATAATEAIADATAPAASSATVPAPFAPPTETAATAAPATAATFTTPPTPVVAMAKADCVAKVERWKKYKEAPKKGSESLVSKKCSSEEEEARRRANRNRIRSWRVRKHYLVQCDELNKSTSFEKKPGRVWEGTVTEGRWQKVYQLSMPGDVRIYGGGRKRRIQKDSVIVRRIEDDKEVLPLEIVPSCRLEINETCHAKEYSFQGTGSLAVLMTGDIDGFSRVKWHMEGNKERWVDSSCIARLPDKRGQRVRNPPRFFGEVSDCQGQKPGKKIARVVTEQDVIRLTVAFQASLKCLNDTTERCLVLGYSRPYICTIQRAALNLMEYSPHQLVDEGKTSLGDYQQCGKPSEWKPTAKSNIIELLSMTLVFKALIGEMNASIKPLDEVLGIGLCFPIEGKYPPAGYAPEMINMVPDHSPDHSPEKYTGKKGSPCHKCHKFRGLPQYNGNCRGCYLWIHEKDLSYFCIDCKLVRVRVRGYRCSGCAEGTRKKRPKCVQCNGNQAFRKGLLCRSCFKRSHVK